MKRGSPECRGEYRPRSTPATASTRSSGLNWRSFTGPLGKLARHTAAPERPSKTVIRPCEVPSAIHLPVLLKATFEILRSIGAFRRAAQLSQPHATITAAQSANVMALFGVRNFVVTFLRTPESHRRFPIHLSLLQ